jgi:hypothetical protein
MSNNTPQQVPTATDAQSFPHHSASPGSPLEAAERQYAERPVGAPNWQPEEGDFS